jgi:hypothetical protein
MAQLHTISIQWCAPCDRWRAVQQARTRVGNPAACPVCSIPLQPLSATPVDNPAPCMHVQCLGTTTAGRAKLVRALNTALATYPAQPIYIFGDFGGLTLLDIDTPKRCSRCKMQRRAARQRRTRARQERAAVHYYMDTEGMSADEAHEAVSAAYEDARGW